ncbi:hypothetical protein L332_03380 [Agrococcus pavilionensis RW1]|uniref:Uncharacterized protein n=1 Tax=Agrococcus pavilionensis RW1 TaxID=1330458 RepID=U1LNF7_9MICO|nr:hypothetical protein [Agrococcus pavilionensis]ERG63497.1 hypothetical protein L332_03380 [Agrococcus pavilionensis RW1]
MAPTFAELALGSAPKRPTVEQVAGLVEADLAKKQQDAEAAVRELKRQRRIEAAKAARAAAVKGEQAARGIAAVRRATKGQGE